MYNREQFQQTMQQVAAKQKTYTEDSIDQARKKWDEASALVEHIKAGGRSIYDIHEAYQKESDARTELDDAVKYSSHLQMAKRQRELAAAKEAEKHKEQVQQSAEEKAAYRAEARIRWLAAGGNEHQFSEQFESLWTDEVKRRVQQVPSEQEMMTRKLMQSGRYGF